MRALLITLIVWTTTAHAAPPEPTGPHPRMLLDKQLARAVNLEPDYCAFTCPNEFVVGYGMDVAHRYRELPFVGRVVRQ